MDKVQDAIKLLKVYNQDHIIKLLNKLKGTKKEELIDQINKIDFHQIMELYSNTKSWNKRKQNRKYFILRQSKIIQRTKRRIWHIRRKYNKKWEICSCDYGRGSRK